jgi:uncharacterized RmlC-like cupin family protein
MVTAMASEEPGFDRADGVRIDLRTGPEREDGISQGGVTSRDRVKGVNIFMKEETIAPGAAGIPHLHPHETAIRMLEGRVRVDWGYGSRLEFSDYAEAGDAIYIPAGAAHRPVNEGKSRAVALVVRNAPVDVIIPVDQ